MLQRGDTPACLFENQCTGGVIPRLLARVQEGVNASASHVTPLQNRCAAHGNFSEGLLREQRRTQPAEPFVTTDFNMRIGQMFRRKLLQALAVEKRAAVLECMKDLAVVGVKHDAEHAPATMHQRHGHAEVALAAGEICGAIERVDAPAPVGFAPDVFLFRLGHFFAKDRAIENIRERLCERRFHHAISFGDDRAIMFALCRDMFEARHEFARGDIAHQICYRQNELRGLRNCICGGVCGRLAG